MIQGASDLQDDGSEDVGGVDCYRVTGKVQADKLKPLLNTAEGTQELDMELWIGKDDMLLRRLAPDRPDLARRGRERRAHGRAVGSSTRRSRSPRRRPRDASAALTARGVTRRYGSRVALEPTDLDVRTRRDRRPARPERRRQVDAARAARRSAAAARPARS